MLEVVLSIGKLRPGRADYYLSKVAEGIEDYYSGAGEAPGWWAGGAGDELALAGTVEGEMLYRALAGQHPRTGAQLANADRADRVPGYDLTFSAPKSVSLLFALGEPEVARQAREAHDAAVAAALGYMERQGAVARRGHGGSVSVQGNGFLAAAFRHRASRAPDPQLHTHVLVANMTRGPDGRWTALDGRRLYAHARTGGYLYQAQLRAELTRRLGVQWTQVRNGHAEIAGFLAPVLRAFSRRRTEIEQRMAERGEHSAKAAQTATLDTRNAKIHIDGASLSDSWRARAAQLDFEPAKIERCLQRVEARVLDERAVEHAQDRLAGPRGLTRQRSSFTRRDVIRAWCEQLPEGADVPVIEELADEYLASERAVPLATETVPLTSSDVIRLADGRVVPALQEERPYSTPELLELERATIDHALAGADANLGTVAPSHVDAAIGRRRWLSAEQQSAIRRLCEDGAAVQVLIGKAGSGKTSAMNAARDAWEAGGYRVLGAALARRTALELQDDAGIESTSVAALLEDLRAGGQRGLLGEDSTVLVIDEASMVGTRHLAEIIDHAAAARAKLVLIGDPKQLPEIHAGGLFRGLSIRSIPIVLKQNRRQREAWERRALDLLRAGHARHAVPEYEQHGRLVLAETAEQLREDMVADWWQQREEGREAVMIAVRHDDVRELNDHARALMTRAGRLGGHPIEIAGREFAVGDQIVTLRNARRLGVLNGTRATITAIDDRRRALTIHTIDGRELTLPSSYLEPSTIRRQRRIDYAYAITGHKAQGMTAEATLVLGGESLYQEWGYVALSRGRGENRLYITAPTNPDRDEIAPAEEPQDPVKATIGQLSTSHAQKLAIDTADAQIVRLSADPPAYLLAALGPVPDQLTARRRWQKTAGEIELYRQEHAIEDLDHALGAEPTDLRQRAEWRGLRREIDRSSRQLDGDRELERAIEP